MCCARVKLSMMSIGAPQGRHARVGLPAVIGAVSGRGFVSPGRWLMQKIASGGDVALAVAVVSKP